MVVLLFFCILLYFVVFVYCYIFWAVIKKRDNMGVVWELMLKCHLNGVEHIRIDIEETILCNNCINISWEHVISMQLRSLYPINLLEVK